VLVVAGMCAAVAAVMAFRPRDITPDVTAAIERALASSSAAQLRPSADDDVRRFYAQRASAPAWLRDNTPTGADALQLVRSAPNHGLVAADYGDAKLAAMIEQLDRSWPETPEDVARVLADIDVHLTTAVLSLGRDVALGRSSPAALDARWKARRLPPDLVGTLSAALSGGTLDAWLDTVRPAHPEYAALQYALAALQNGPDAPPDKDARIATIALNLERWRWLPDDFGARHVLVNIPAFSMAVRENGMPVLKMKVVVGKTDHATPIFSGEMSTVVFSPYWNVPDSIVEGETAPAAARDPEFLARNHIEILRTSNSGTEVVDPRSVNWDDAAALKTLAFRQLPGPGNALGHVKFLFPNKYDVYLHDTPADALFARPKRALSHGCIRLEQPDELARYVLRGRSEWDDARIKTAMYSGDEKHVALDEKIPVHIVYFTAWPDASGGVATFPDVYGYDAKQTARARAGQGGARKLN
jgi:murein L,D-transpeptidase YcbB/YkuD